MDSVNVTLDVNLFVMGWEESKAGATTLLPADATFRRR